MIAFGRFFKQKTHSWQGVAHPQASRYLQVETWKYLGIDDFTIYIIENHHQLTIYIFKGHVVVSEIILRDLGDI